MKPTKLTQTITKATLKILATVDELAITPLLESIVATPNLRGGIRRRPAPYLSTIDTTIRRLRRNGSIMLTRGASGMRYALTEKGRRILARHELREASIERPKRWDNNWRIVIFDVPEKRRHQRNLIRKALANFGFIHLQNSVWMFPFPCEKLVELARTAYHIRRNVFYLISKRFEGDEHFAFKFGLGPYPYD